MQAMVVFHVGIKHPLYNNPVLAEIISANTGYDGRQVYAKTVEEVFYPADPEGLLIYKNGVFVGFKTREAYSDYHTGYCELV